MAATTAQSVLIDTYYTHYFTVISIICIILRIISNIEIQIWVHINCRKLANRHNHNWGSVSKQNHVQEGLKYQSIHLESCTPGQDWAKWYVLVRTSTYQYETVQVSTRITSLYIPVCTSTYQYVLLRSQVVF